MSSYVRRYKNPSYKVINHHRYKFLRSYAMRQDAIDEANRWNREPGISAKATKDGEFWTVWVAEKQNWR
jgi:hypothetical protein